MERNDTLFCWTYNLLDKETYANVLKSENVDLNIDLGSEDQVNVMSDLVIQRIKGLEEGDLSMNFESDVKSFNFLRLVSSLAGRGKGWYVQKECDLFLKRIRGLAGEEIVYFLNDILFNNTVMETVSGSEHDNYDEKIGSKRRAKVKWEHFSDLISDRKSTVDRGWIYTTVEDTVIEVMKIFKSLLLDNVKETMLKLKTNDMGKVFGNYTDLVDSMVPIVGIPENASIGYVLDRSPMCIRLLDNDVGNGIDINYKAYLILSFYLKTYIEMDDLVQYFYGRNPNNTRSYSSVEEFLAARKELRYIFKQMYGETGGGVSYESFACKTISKEGCCPYSSINNMETEEETIEKIKTMIESMDGEALATLDDDETRKTFFTVVGKMARKGSYKRACGLEFQLKYSNGDVNRGMKAGEFMSEKKYVGHPVKAYLEDALKLEENQEG